MPRDARAYLADIVESCDAITVAVRDLDLARYQGSRLVRSSVEREFIIEDSESLRTSNHGMQQPAPCAAADAER